MKDRLGNNGYRVSDNCQVDADSLEDMLTHLADHGPSSVLLSTRFASLISCFLAQIENAITDEWAHAIRADIEQDGAASPADETTESPAAVGFRRVSKRVAVTYGKGGRWPYSFLASVFSHGGIIGDGGSVGSNGRLSRGQSDAVGVGSARG